MEVARIGEAVLRICMLVEGMPLGIELAATWLKVLNCEQIAQEITRGVDGLDQQKSRLFTEAYRQAWATVGGELDNIRHGWQWLIEAVNTGRQVLPVTTLLRQMAEVFANYYLFQSLTLSGQALFVNACQVIETAQWADDNPAENLAGGRHSPQDNLVHLQIITGIFHFERGHFRAGLAVAEQAIDVCRTRNPRLFQALSMDVPANARTHARPTPADYHKPQG